MPMRPSEEIIYINEALKCCDQLKINLQATLLHVQMLNTKYNSFAAIQSNYTFGIITLTPKKSVMPQRLRMECQTPGKLNRSLQEIKQTNNNIIVRGIKVRREVETVVNQLKRIREIYRKDQINGFRRRIYYQSENNGATPSAKCSHINCLRGNSPMNYKSPNHIATSTPLNRRRITDKLKIHSPRTC